VILLLVMSEIKNVTIVQKLRMMGFDQRMKIWYIKPVDKCHISTVRGL